MRVVILGLTITSSWGNGHATTYRSLCRALHARGHEIEFIEKDVEWYASHRDLPNPPYCRTSLYADWERDGRKLVCRLAADADVVVIGSYFPDAITATHVLLDRVEAPIVFYDIDTPITLAGLRTEGRVAYLEAELIPHYSAYMSFTGGPVLRELETRFGSPMAAPLYCSVDPTLYKRVGSSAAYACDLSYLGTYSADRQEKLERLFNEPARRLPYQSFLVAGAMYPEALAWPSNIRWLSHVAPSEHAAFYSSSRFTLNLTREEMARAGYSPSVRLFEAAACGVAILSDMWPGLDTFFTPGEEIVTVLDTDDVSSVLCDMPDGERIKIGSRAADRILASHTSAHRAREFESTVEQIGLSRKTEINSLP